VVDALIVTEVVEATVVVDAENVTDVVPAGTVTELGTVVLGSLEVKETDRPPAGALPLRVTVPVELEPPVTVVGFKVSPVKLGAFTVKVADLLALFRVPVIVTDVALATGVVVTLNVAEVAPPRTVTFVGTVPAALLAWS